jgi:hypothetical protein
MKKILLLVAIVGVGYSAHAQEGWVNFPIDQNVEVLFPGKPNVENTFDYSSAQYELPGVSFQYVRLEYKPDSGKQVTSTDELKLFYEWVFETRIIANGGTIDTSSFEMQRDIMMANARYRPIDSDDPCEVRLLFVKNQLYSFSVVGTDGNLEFGEKSKTFLNSVTINNNLTPEDQFTARKSSFDPKSSVNAFVWFSVVLVFAWAVLLVMVIVKGRVNTAPIWLWRLFSIVRWTLVGVALLMCTIMAIATIDVLRRGTGEHEAMTIIAVVSLALVLAALFLRPASPTRPAS